MRAVAQVATSRTPLTVIGGFLGAGKTTFLNHVLAGSKGRIAVLVNDFGAINVDAGLIADHDGKTLRLTNGCVCCSLADGFLETMMRVLAEPFDHVIVEASGVGDPWAIAEIALVEPSLVLGAVIVLADAERFETLAHDQRVGDTIRRQIRSADILLLNKTDLVDKTKRRAAGDLLQALRPHLRIIETRNAAVPLELLDDQPHEGVVRRRWPVADAGHEEIFVRLLYRRDGVFVRSVLDRALASLPPSILRLKGVVTFADGGERAMLQMVGERMTFSAAPSSFDTMASIEIVGIGTRQDADEAALAKALDGALSQARPDAA